MRVPINEFLEYTGSTYDWISKTHEWIPIIILGEAMNEFLKSYQGNLWIIPGVPVNEFLGSYPEYIWMNS